jgi:hypothetical protein
MSPCFGREEQHVQTIIQSVFVRVAEDLVNSSEDVLSPSELNLFFLLRSGDLCLGEVDITLIFLGILQHDLDNGGLLPIIEFPLHFYVLALPQGQVFALDFSLEDGELTPFNGMRLSLGSSIMHDLA